MSKFIKAVNVMVSNPTFISDVIRGVEPTECFFLYDKKHAWSILQRKDGHYRMAYYPGDQDLDYLASIPPENWNQSNIVEVVYTSSDIGTKEAKESMSELFNIVNQKVFGMDNILDEIINTDIPF